MQRKLTAVFSLTIIAITLIPCHVRGQSLSSDEYGDKASSFGPKKVIGDVKHYVTAPLHWDSTDWLYFGSTVVAIGAAHQFDGRIRKHFTAGSKTALDGKDTHSLQDAIPAAAAVVATGIYATLIDDPAGGTEIWSMLEAGALASTTGLVLKLAAARERPNATTDPNRWRARGDSFPSLHVTAAFAIGTVLAESGNDEYRWIRRFLGYGIAAATGYERLKHNTHWLSDTVAGAALGMASAHFVLNHEGRSERSGALAVVPLDGGVMLTYNIPLQ